MTITLIVGGRWHMFDHARELLKAGLHPRLVTNYPRFKTRKWGIPDEHVVSLPASMLLEQTVRRLTGERGFARVQGWVHRIFAAQAARHLTGTDIAHGLSGFCLPSMQAAAPRPPFVLERLSSHIETQSALLNDEAARMSLTLPKTHPDIVSMELAEYAAADAIIVPSLFVEETFVARGIPRAKLHRNLLGVDLTSFAPPAHRGQVGPFRVLCVGSKSARKGIHDLRQGFAEARLPDAELRFIGGDLPETTRLLGPIHRQVVSIKHLPQRELAREYQQASVFAMPSIEDGFGMVFAQALSSGVPIICSSNTGGEDLLIATHDGPLPDLSAAVREYAAGFVVPIRQPSAIASCLRRLHDDPSLLREKSAAALRIRQRNLDWQAYSRRCITLYTRLLAR